MVVGAGSTLCGAQDSVSQTGSKEQQRSRENGVPWSNKGNKTVSLSQNFPKHIIILKPFKSPAITILASVFICFLRCVWLWNPPPDFRLTLLACRHERTERQ